MRRIAFVCEKGGTGKTTTATAVAVGLAGLGARVLLVDADQQGNASWTLLGGQGPAPPTLAAVLTRQAAALEAIRPSATRGLDLLPADASLGGVNVMLAQELGRDTRLRSALAAIEGQYDYVLLDTGPQFTTVMANVLVYAVEVVVPLDPGVFAMLGVVQLGDTLAEVREAYGNDRLHLAGLVLTKMQRSNVARDVEAELRARFGDLVYGATVPLSSKIEEAHTRGQTVMEFAPKSAGAVAYGKLIGEIVEHGRAKDRGGVEAVGGSGAGHAA
jgi:chromosome partitioning protein